MTWPKFSFSILIFLGILFPIYSFAFQISGKVFDTHGNGISYASVFILGTSIGTSTNSEGAYSLEIPLGKQFIRFNSLGYKSKTVEILAQEGMNHQLNIVLEDFGIGLREIVVRSNSDNPANEIIRRVISRKKQFDSIIRGFTCSVYAKAIQRLDNAPKKFLGRDIKKPLERMGLDSGKRGIIYLSESVSKLKFRRPDSYFEEIISSKISGNPQGFTFNQISDNILDFNKNIMNLPALNLNRVISPIHDHAFDYYRFELVERNPVKNGYVDKIKVIPKNKFSQTYQGFLYINEPDFKIGGLDLYLTKEAGMQFIDTVNIRQNFIDLQGDSSVMVGQQFFIRGSAFGFHFNGSISYSFSDFKLNPVWREKEFSKLEIKVDHEANTRDSSYWKRIRPIPLTEEEKIDYTRKETLYKIRHTRTYMDSVDKVDSRFHLSDFILRGYSFRNSYKREFWSVNSFSSFYNYNTVEGLVLNPLVTFRKRTSDSSGFSLGANIRYGFTNQHFNISLISDFQINRKKNQGLSFQLGSRVQDFNSLGSLDPAFNTFQTTFNKLNILKLYEKRFAYSSFFTRILPGFSLETHLEYSDRLPLVNTSFYSFRKISDQSFTANNPNGGLNNSPAFQENKALQWEVNFNIHIGEKYIDRPEGIFVTESIYPKLNVQYRKGIHGIGGSSVDYDFLSFKVYDENLDIGVLGSLNYTLEAGKYFNSNSLSLMDGENFASRTGSLSKNLNTPFLVINPYLYTSFQKFALGGIQNNFKGILFNKIPLLRQLKLNEILGGSFLKSDDHPFDSEIYGGISRLGFGLNYVISLSQGQIKNKMITFSLGF